MPISLRVVKLCDNSRRQAPLTGFDVRLRRLMPFEGTTPIVRLQAGDIFFDPAPHRLMTLLGSCVAVCLWDRCRRMGGMTHSLLPRSTGEGGPAGRDVDAAINDLVNRMIRAGCRTEDMAAKMFGGFTALSGLGTSSRIGKANVESAVHTLDEWGIEIVAQEILREGGIVIYQNTETGDVSGRLLGMVGRG